jgi:hypothetical protein
MIEHAEVMPPAVGVTAAEKPPLGVAREESTPRFIVTGLIVSYVIALAPIVAGYLMIKGYV